MSEHNIDLTAATTSFSAMKDAVVGFLLDNIEVVVNVIAVAIVVAFVWYAYRLVKDSFTMR